MRKLSRKPLVFSVLGKENSVAADRDGHLEASVPGASFATLIQIVGKLAPRHNTLLYKHLRLSKEAKLGGHLLARNGLHRGGPVCGKWPRWRW